MLGVLGGMGPQATADFLHKLVEQTAAETDQRHMPVVVWSVPQIPDRSRAILAGGESPLPAMLRGLEQLRAMGANAAAIPCNTAHHWYDALAARTDMPILHIVDSVADDLRRRLPDASRIGLMATRGTIAAGIYEKRLPGSCRLLVPETSDLDDLMEAIGWAKGGQLERARTVFARIADGLRARGAQAIVMGCTEIPLAPPPGDDLIDSTDALAVRCTKWFAQSHWGVAA